MPLIVGSDYQSETFIVTFAPIVDDVSTQEKCGSVSIIDDAIPGEPNESFSVRLISANPAGSFGNSETCVTIVDNDDGKLELCFCVATNILYCIILQLTCPISGKLGLLQHTNVGRECML